MAAAKDDADAVLGRHAPQFRCHIPVSRVAAAGGTAIDTQRAKLGHPCLSITVL
jgi:hypothetical protein